MKRGFTLLEMIIVVSVLAILFLLSVPNIQRVMKIVDEKGLLTKQQTECSGGEQLEIREGQAYVR